MTPKPAVLMLMERLAPQERAAYVLREAFDCPYAQIGNGAKHSPPWSPSQDGCQPGLYS